LNLAQQQSVPEISALTRHRSVPHSSRGFCAMSVIEPQKRPDLSENARNPAFPPDTSMTHRHALQCTRPNRQDQQDKPHILWIRSREYNKWAIPAAEPQELAPPALSSLLLPFYLLINAQMGRAADRGKIQAVSLEL
jgi:hypothetical protein